MYVKMAAKILLAPLHPSWGNMNFSSMTKWFWVTIKGYLSYIMPKFEDLVPTSIGSGPFLIFVKFYITRQHETGNADGCAPSGRNQSISRESRVRVTVQ